MKSRFGCTEFTLKLTALLFMILDHVHTYLAVGPEWLGLLSRFVAPLFVYFLVEGFFHTRNWGRYFARVFAVALVTMAGNVAINFLTHSVNYATGEMDLYALLQGNNIFMTLAVYLVILELLARGRKRGGAKAGAAFAGAALLGLISLPFCEGSPYLLPLLLAFYFGYGKKTWAYLAVTGWSALLFVQAVASYLSGGTGVGLAASLCFESQWAMIAVVLPIALYNGQRGPTGPGAKWLFYGVYPAHLWILRIASKLLVG